MPKMTRADNSIVESATHFDLIQIQTRGNHELRLTVSERWPNGEIAQEPDGKKGSEVFSAPITEEDGTPNLALVQAMRDAATTAGIDISALPDALAGKMLLDAVKNAAVIVAKANGYLAADAVVDSLLS